MIVEKFVESTVDTLWWIAILVRNWLSSDHCVYPQNQTPDTMTIQLSAIYSRERNEGECDREDRS
jgi:hypothetical protein